MRTMPFFLTNEEWYTLDLDDEERGYRLTEKAPQEAIDSYNELYGDEVYLEGEAAREFASYSFD